jgi:hypothetical protein
MSVARDPLQGFVHAAAGNLLDGHGEPLMLRGVGLGNWLLPEGYMWRFEPPGPQSPREIEALVEELVGHDRADQFWQRFKTTFIAEDDIAQIRAEGMNHVRLPINSRVVMDDEGQLIKGGFDVIDGLIEWCRSHQLWVVLDLHGAPGGQTGTNIDDSPHGAPELFTNDRYRALTIGLWRAFAQRYRNETVVAAYDLLNEPLPNEYQHIYADRLRDLYVELTAAIRDIDPNHVICYEGSHWATNWTMFTEVWDQNSVLQFHKYWSPPDRPSIQTFIDAGHRLGLPIYMGEGGENNLDWLQTAFQLYDDCGISWNFWPWKKVDTLTSPCSVSAPPGWRHITDYAAGKAAKPGRAEAWQILDELLEAMPLARCTYRSEIISAVLRRPPLRIPAVGFGFDGAGKSYKTSGAVPLTGFRSDDLVTIRLAGGIESGALDWHHNTGVARSVEEELLVSLDIGDWVAYDIAITEPMRLDFVVASDRPAIEISVDDVVLDLEDVGDGTVSATANWLLSGGHHVVRITGLAQETLVRSIEVTPAGRQAIRELEERSTTVP